MNIKSQGQPLEYRSLTLHVFLDWLLNFVEVIPYLRGYITPPF